MCKYLVENEKCEIRMTQPDGSKNPKASANIRAAFLTIAENSEAFKKETNSLGLACGGDMCCFKSGKYATWTDCPYFQKA